MKQHSRKEILDVIPKKVNDRVTLPQTDNVNWRDHEFIALRRRDGRGAVLIRENGGQQLQAVEVETLQRIGGAPAKMCDICETQDKGDQIIPVTVRDRHKSTTFQMCADFNCSERVRGRVIPLLTSVAPRPPAEVGISKIINNLNKLFD